MSKQILVAVHTLTSGTGRERQVTKGGAVFTQAEQKKHGLSAKDVDELIARGAIAEREALAAEAEAPVQA